MKHLKQVVFVVLIHFEMVDENIYSKKEIRRMRNRVFPRIIEQYIGLYAVKMTLMVAILASLSMNIESNAFAAIQSVVSGEAHSVALKDDGTVWAWGLNQHWGIVGDGTIRTKRLTPVRVLNLNDITAIAAGEIHTIALKNDGTVWAWGWNGLGALGNGTDNDSENFVPTQITGLGNVKAIAAGR